MSQKFEKPYWNFVEIKFKNGYNFADLLPILRRHINRIERHVDEIVRVLDVGCGFGYFLKLCDKLYWDTYGIDVSSHAIDMARKNTKAQLYLHDIQNSKKRLFKENYFDLITMFDVLEHLDFPVVGLKEAHRILKHGGKLVVTTPNLHAAERIVLKILAKETLWHGFYDLTHVNLFTPSSLKTLVKAIGFGILELRTPFHSLPVPVSNVLEKTGLGGQIWLLAEKA